MTIMLKLFTYVLLLFVMIPYAMGQTQEVGPFTITKLTSEVIRIEDANSSNPSGLHTDGGGKTIGLNNCSDMYLILGREKSLLVDLSNFVTWDSTAMKSLQSIVHEAGGARELYIAVTHFHGDHTGMLPAFKDDPKVKFWIQPEEFTGRNIFPTDRLIPIPKNPTLDLGGGVVVNSFELPGHTEHSMLYFLKDKNLVFTGDGVGSGNGVWIFSYDGFLAYQKSIDKLIAYVQNPANRIDAKRLLIYPGHYWQKRDKTNIPFQYILDMKTLIQRIKTGNAGEDPVTFNKYLDTNFQFGSAIITWNKNDANRFKDGK